MKRRLGIAVAVLALILLVMQFFSPELGEENIPVPEGDFIRVATPAPAVAQLLTSSCYDCHSQQSNYPWYARVAPISWYLDKHIQEGRSELNFSEYGDMSKLEKLGTLQGICEVLEAGTMPLQSYLLVHRNAQISEEDAKVLCEWVDREVESLLEGE